MKASIRIAGSLGLAAILGAAGLSPTAAAEMEASWSNGIRLGTEDGATQIKLGGRIQNDWVWQRGEDRLLDNIGEDLEDGTEFRRLRLYMSGQIAGATIFKTQLDFAGGKVSIKDAYVGVRGIPGLGQITVGHQYEPFGLEEQTSSKYLTFLERGLVSAFTPERNSGILAQNSNGRANWGAGIFRETGSNGVSTGDGEYNATARVGVRPVDDRDGRRLVHLGVAGSLRNPPGDEVEFAAGPENHLAPDYVGTGTLMADRVDLLGLEAALVEGPFSLQGEYVVANLATLDNLDPSFDAFYILGSYFLTGEHRAFKRSNGTFDRVKPLRPYDGAGSPGAWELTARFSRLDLDQDGASGSALTDLTAGVGWYLNPNVRWYANYVRAELSDDGGASDAVLMRFQADF